MIVISGSSGGIGSYLSNDLSKYNEIIGLFNSSKPINHNSEILYEKLPLQDENKVIEFVDKHRAILSNVTLVHCAAIKTDELMVNIDSIIWDEIFNINVKGAFLLTKYLLKVMIANRWGRIIYLSSKGSQDGDIGTAAYSSSKTALLGLSRTISKEYASFNITSNVILLGAFDVGLYKELSEKVKTKILEKVPSKNTGSVKNISNAINFIIDSDYVNGSVITIDGGV
jgi:3-oxoacyl-[acyl-carrier protein] reductase